MTIEEMHYDFELKRDRVSSATKEDFNVAEIDWILNEAQNVIVKTRYGGNNMYRTSFEQTQKRVDDLKSLHIKFPIQPMIDPVLNSGIYEVDLSTLAFPYWFFTRGEVQVFDDPCNKFASLKFVQVDDLNEALSDPFNNSDSSQVIFNFGRSSLNANSSSIYLYPGNETLGKIKLEYVKKPSQMFVGGYTYLDNTPTIRTNCELPDHVHPELVDIAVMISKGITEDPGFRNAMQKISISE